MGGVNFLGSSHKPPYTRPVKQQKEASKNKLTFQRKEDRIRAKVGQRARCQSASGSEHKEILSEIQRQVVSGARRVWGTLQSATLYAVRATIVKLTKCIETDDMRVKRKCGLTNSGKTKWWFVIHGKEEMLKSLEESWSKVSVQTGWCLEQCTKPSVTMSTIY